MVGELLAALRGGTEQFVYYRHTYSPLSPWRRPVERLLQDTRREAARYGIGAAVSRRRAYQVARMSVADADGRHLQQLVPDAWQAYSPPSAATYHDGKRRYPSPSARLQAFRSHPQTLAYLLIPDELARRGFGGSAPGGLGVILEGEQLDEAAILQRLQQQARGAGQQALRRWAGVLAALHRGAAGEGDAAAS